MGDQLALFEKCRRYGCRRGCVCGAEGNASEPEAAGAAALAEDAPEAVGAPLSAHDPAKAPWPPGF